MSPSREHLFGIDFSGAQNPGRSIWITEACHKESGIEVIDCQSAVDRFECGTRPSRDEVYAQLKALVRDHPTAVFGFDFPFGLPSQVTGEMNSWREYLQWLAEDFDGSTAAAFQQHCVEQAAETTGDSQYLRRETDWRYGGQCPYQHQIRYQTFYGQRDLLAPLVLENDACVLPMQEADERLPWLVEVYPAATLGVERLYRQGYKRHTESESRRQRNIEQLEENGMIISEDAADRCRESDDAHDSLVAVLGVYSGLVSEFTRETEDVATEGQIFA